MKYQLFSIVLGLFLFTSCFKQDGEVTQPNPNSVTAVQSSCTSNPTIANIYMEDANRLALRATLANSGSIWNDSVKINPEKTAEILGALLAVHNGTKMIYRDTVIAVYGIHTLKQPLLNRMLVEVDTSYAWVRRWKDGNQYTTNDIVDEMVNEFSLRNVDYNEFATGNFVTLQSDYMLNIKELVKHFEGIDGVLGAEIDAVKEDGNEITYSYNPSNGYKELVYSVGYKNCETSCEKRRYWKFYVRDHNCSLEFISSWGDVAP